MNPSKLIALLVATTLALGALIGLYIWKHRPESRQIPFADSVDKAERIMLQIEGAPLELIRDSSTWTVSASTVPPRYPADSAKVATLLSSLRAVALEDVISQRPEAADDFMVNPGSATQVALYGANNARLAAGLFGKQAPDFYHIYFRFPDRPDVYLARGVIRGDLGTPDLAFWRDRALLNVKEDEITSIEIKGPGYITHLTRSSDTWSLNGKAIPSDPVWKLLGALAHLRADDFVDFNQHPDLTPDQLRNASVTVELKEGHRQTLRFGPLDKKAGRYPVATGSNPGTAWIAEGNGQSILKKPSEFGIKK